jgi:hypothetical protein
MAKGDGVVFLDSGWSDTETYEIPEIRGLQFTLIKGDTEYSVAKGTAANAEILIPSIRDGKPITAIASEGFTYYTALTGITIPDTVTSIEGDAFYGCSSLTNVTIGDGVTSIGHGAFYNCSSLASIEIPSGVTSIGYCAFYGCTSLTSIEIPSGVTSIGGSAFY